MIAALFVETNGVYYGLEGVDPWDIIRDARTYTGPFPVIAHPPCERWGRYWSGGPMLARTPKAKKLGDDNGCFKAALNAVRCYGGVLEHPEASHAWRAFGLNRPPKSGGWIQADEYGGWTCCVEQGHYGHRARKATWLYYHGRTPPPDLIWGPAEKTELRIDPGFHSTEERRRVLAGRRDSELFKRLGKVERKTTPLGFRDLLISLALRADNR